MLSPSLTEQGKYLFAQNSVIVYVATTLFVIMYLVNRQTVITHSSLPTASPGCPITKPLWFTNPLISLGNHLTLKPFYTENNSSNSTLYIDQSSTPSPPPHLVLLHHKTSSHLQVDAEVEVTGRMSNGAAQKQTLEVSLDSGRRRRFIIPKSQINLTDNIVYQPNH